MNNLQIKSLFIIATGMMAGEGFASEYKLESINQFNVIHSTKLATSLGRNQSAPRVDCEDILEKLEQKKPSIQNCAAGGDQPESYCRYIKNYLKKILTQYQSNQSDSFQSDVFQEFDLTAKSTGLSSREIQKISETESLNKDSVLVSTANLQSISYVGIEADPSSFTFLLETAPLLKSKPEVTGTQQEAGLTLKVGNRLTTCEIESGKIKILATVKTSHQYQAIEKDIDLDAYWDFSQSFSSDLELLEGSSLKRAVWAGFLLGEFAKESLEVEVSPKISKQLAVIFADLSNDNVRSVDYANKYLLGVKLPQEENSAEFNSKIEVKND